MDWLSENAWVGWLGIAAVLGAAELVSLDLVLIMLAVGALAGGVSAALGAAFIVQILIAGVAPQRSYAFADATAIQAVLGEAGVSLPAAAAGSELSTGAVVERVSGAVQPIVCGL